MEGESKVFLAVILALVAIAITLALVIAGLPPEEGFTELYLIGETPGEAVAGREYAFSFGIKNLQGTGRMYEYEVSLDSEVVDEGKITLAAGESGIISESFAIGRVGGGEPIKVSIRLKGLSQEIHFWVMPR